MEITGEHAAAERALRELLPDAGLPQPDEVENREESVVFLWHVTKLAVSVDLAGTEAAEGRAARESAPRASGAAAAPPRGARPRHVPARNGPAHAGSAAGRGRPPCALGRDAGPRL